MFQTAYYATPHFATPHFMRSTALIEGAPGHGGVITLPGQFPVEGIRENEDILLALTVVIAIEEFYE